MPVLSKSNRFREYGLSNKAGYFKGFIYRGHGGSLPGGNADFAYLPEYNMGYAIMTNGGDKDVVNKIAGLIKYFQTKDFVQKTVEIDSRKYKTTIDPSGYYTIINPKIDLIGFIERIKNVQKVWFKDDTLYIKHISDKSSTQYIPAANNEFRSIKTKRIELALITDPLEGNIICNSGFLKKISPLWAYTLITIPFAFPITLVCTIIFAFLWTLVYWFGKKKSKTALWICLLPFITNSFIFIVIITSLIKIQTRYDVFQLFGTVNPFSVLILICSICYALASVWSVFYIFRNRREKMSVIFYFYSALAAILNLFFMLYFLSNGLIGIPTWI